MSMNSEIYFFCAVCTKYRNRDEYLTYIGYKGGWLSCCKKCNDKLKQMGYLNDDYRLIKYVPLYRIEQLNYIETDSADDSDDSDDEIAEAVKDVLNIK